MSERRLCGGEPTHLSFRVGRDGEFAEPKSCHSALVKANDRCRQLIEQDHRAIKRIVRPMPGFKDINCARRLIAGIETMHMVKKGQLDGPRGETLSAADPFYSLAF